MEQNKRILYLDVLRIAATFAVIFLHVSASEYFSSYISFDWYVSCIGDSLVRWAVPMFVMISGALFLNPLKEVSMNSLFKKSLPRLILAYFFWWAAYSAVLTCGSTIIGHNAFSLKYILHPHFHLWFLPMLMGIYLIIPFLRKIVGEKKLIVYYLLIWFLFTTLEFVPIVGEFVNKKGIMMHFVIGYSGYFVLGYYLSQTALSKKYRSIVYILGILGALVGIFGNILLSSYQGTANTRFLENISPHVIAMTAAIFVFVQNCEPSFGRKTKQIVEYLRKDLFGIYLVHAAWLLVLNNDYLRHCCNTVVTIPVITIAVFVGSLYTTKVIRKIPLLRKTVE